MEQAHRGIFTYWGLIGLLAIAPVLYGSQQPWAALSVTSGIVGLLALRWLRALWRTSPSIVWCRQDLMFVLALLWVLIGVARPAAPPEALDAFLLLLGYLASFLLARALAVDNWALALAKSLCVIGGAIALVALFQALDVVAHGWWDPPQFVAATFVNHNHFAAYLELLLPLSCAIWWTARRSPAQRFLMALSCSLMAVGLILSCSRGAWLSLAMASTVSLALFVLRSRRSLWNWRVALGVVGGLVAIGVLISQPPILARGMSLLDAPSDESFQIRQAVWKGTWNLAKEAPLIGHGVGSFAFEFPRHRPAGLPGSFSKAFNEYLQLVVELGLVGLVIAGMIAVFLIRRIVRLIRLSHTPWKRAVGVGALIGLGSVMVHSLVDYPWQIPGVVFPLVAIAGLVSGIPYRADPAPLRRWPLSVATSHQPWFRWAASAAVLGGLGMLLLAASRLIVADVWAQRGLHQRQAGSLEAALVSFQHATANAPARVEYQRQLGQSLIQKAWQHQGHQRRAYFAQAAVAYRTALALAPNDAQSAHALGEVLKATGEFEEAQQWLSRAITQDPQNPLVWKHFAELHLIRGQARQASEAFRQAAQLAKPYDFFPDLFEELDNPAHFVQVGKSALFLGRLGIAQSAFLVAQAFDPSHPDAHVGLALTALNREETKTAHQLMASIHDPHPRAQWFAGLAHYHLTRGQMSEAKDALDESLGLDPSNVLARQLQFVVAKQALDRPRATEALNQLAALNRPPVFVMADDTRQFPVVVWEPEVGSYGQGKKILEGWALSNSGSIRQPLVVPPGRVRFRVTARGKTDRGSGPTMALSWNGRLLLMTTLSSGTWATYDVMTEVKPGESLLTVALTDDPVRSSARDYRNLKVEKVVVSWEPL